MSDIGTADGQDSNLLPQSEGTLPNADVEIVEAKTAIILLESDHFVTKNEYIQWRLTSLFQPLAIGEKTQNMQVLYLSHQRKHNWLSDYKNDSSNNILLSAPATPLSPILKRSALPQTKYVLTPWTNVISLMPECRLVFIVDLSSSLATVGNTKSQILLFEVFRTLRNALEGLVHPFCLQTSRNERIMLRPRLLLTVLADCSQFASNVNVIPMLEDHPTMRVFAQNVLLNLNTIDSVIADLYDAFRVFQTDTTTHRKQMKQKRASLGYHLDVGEGAIPTFDRTLFDATTATTKSTQVEEEKTTGVWGMGKTGANLARMLHAGAFAASLFDPPQGRAQLILITDGALKAQFQDNTLWRQFAEQDLACHVIQIGFPQSFIPGRNFGFLPDVEILKFLAQATGGTFLYSNECERLARPAFDPQHDPLSFCTRRTMAMDQEEEDDWWGLNPNIYHRHFVLRESNLEKIRTLTPFSYFTPGDDETKKGSKQQRRRQRRQTAAAAQASSNFPWDPEGTTPPIEWRLLKYRDYPLPNDFSHMIAARAREGFYLQSVLFDEPEDPKKKEWIQLTLVFYWKPHVIIEYRIRAQWQRNKEPFYQQSRSPRAEIFIRSDAEFAHLVQNSYLLRRRFQMMRAIQNDPKGGSHSLTALQKVEKLKTYLQYLYEGDDILNTLIDPEHQYFSGWNNDQGKMDFELLKTRFCSFGASRFISEQDRYQTRCWYDLECLDCLVDDPIDVVRRLTDAWAEITLIKNDNQQMDDVDDGTIPSFVKFLGNSTTLSQHPSFCKIKVQHDYGRLVTLRCLFFNATSQVRQGVKNELCELFKDTFICTRPFSSLLIRDQAHFVVAVSKEEEEEGKDVSNRWHLEQKRRMEKKRSWYMPVGLWLTGEHIVHDYLWYTRWSWPTDIDSDQGLASVQDLAFEYLCQARIGQDYQLVLSRDENTHFYKELQHDQRLHAIQYFIRKEKDGQIQTELWVEPSLGHEQHYEDDSNYSAIQSWTSRQDRKIVSHLVTFDQIHAIGRGCSVTLSDLFDVSLVLKPNPFLVVSYALPRIGEFHRYFESVARKVMDAEIDMSGASSLVWRMLRKALRQYDETRVTEMLCFVQIVDPERFFLLVIPPHQLDCLVFACTRMTMEEAPILLSILKDESEIELVGQGGAFTPPHATSCFLKDAVLDQVKTIHGTAFLKAVYAALLPTRQVWEKDLDQALSGCQTTLISIDLTTFVSTLQDNACGEEMEKKWKLAWSPYFGAITTLSEQDEKPTPASVLLYTPSGDHNSETPLFLGVSCTSEDQLVVKDPMSFIELKSILKDRAPSQRPSFLTTLHDPIKLNLICHSDGPLTEEQTLVLDQTVACLDWMFTEQVLRQALSEHPTKPVLQYVETQLNKHTQNPWRMPFRFVMATNGRQAFMDLFEKKMNEMERRDEYFYVTGTTSYWLLVVVHTDHLHMYYYNFSSPQEKNDQLVENMKERIGQMEKQANQTLLLTKLQETRHCSKYLQVPDHAVSPESDDSGSSQDTSSDASEENVFNVSELQCPEVYNRIFPVHWRVPPHKVLSYLKNDVLRPFLVMNRDQMYVIEREHTVVYCHFREKSMESGYALEMSVRGLECPLWIERDVVPLIENRLTDEVTLVEIQTFFARNPTNKPTLEDVDFILPFEKQVPLTETLCLPMSTDLPKQFRFFKRFLSSHLLRSFQGPQVVAALDTHLTFSSGNGERVGLEKDELCFYYNCTKRIPGVSSAIEVACGQGMAGVLMTIRDTSTLSILTEFPCTDQPIFDPDRIRQTMETDLRKEHGRYVLQVNIWTRGAVAGNVLLDYILDCFRRSLCDTLMEQTVSLDLAIRLPGLRNQFIETVVYLLAKSVEWGNPTVQPFNEAGLDPWCMKEMMQGLKDELIRLDVTLDPTMMWRKLDNDGNEEEEWRLYRGSGRSVGDNVRMVAVSGLSEFIGQFGGPPFRLSRHPKDRSSLKSIPPSRKNSIPQPGSTTASLRSHPTPRSRAASSSSTNSSTSSLLVMNDDEDVSLHPLGGSSLVPQADTEKHCFLIMIIDPDHLTLYAYNWTEPHRVRFFRKIRTLSQYQRLRAGLLDNILHQKMGLFHHSQTVQTLANQFLTESTLTDEPSSQSGEDEEEPRNRTELKKPASGLKIVTAQLRETISIQQIIRKSNVAPNSIPSTPISMKTPASDSKRKEGSTTTSLASPMKKPSIASSTYDDDKKRPRRRVSTRKEEMDLLSMGNPELNQVLLGAISDPGAVKKRGEESDDLLWWHGEPFLTTYLQQARIGSVHRKARQVYTKWRLRFTDAEQEEGLTRYEVASILRSSRLLHFCRAPFFLFTDSACHRSMFIAQYACYLEKLNMQRVQFTGLEEEEEEEEEGKEEPRSTFLLKVFDAGSILCEIRFTHSFVSVTLYGLHRDTGGGSKKTTSKKTRRRDFQMFEKNVAQLKHLIHINSFVYDFHLAYLQKQLLQGNGGGVVPALHRFGAYYTTPTPYSTNRLFSGVYQIVSNDLDSMYATLMEEQVRFGLQALGEDQEAMKVMDVQDLNATQQDHDEGGWKFSLVLCPLQMERHCLYIRYFVLAVHHVERTPGGLVKNVWSAGGQERVLVNARKKIDAIVSKVNKTCHERSDWHRLVSALNRLRFDKWRGLLHKFSHVPLLKGKAEPELARLVDDIHHYQSTAEVFDLFEQMYTSQCVQVIDSDQRHILMFPHAPPSARADHLIHIKIDENGVDLWLVRRDSPLDLSSIKKEGDSRIIPNEKRLVSLLGQGLCYILWKLSL